MIVIREEQFAAFHGITEAAFERRIVDHLLQRHADEVVRLPAGERAIAELPDETLQGMVRTGVARARSYGLTWESSIFAFVTLMFVAAPNFDEHPIINHILKSVDVEPDLRVNKLWELTSEGTWAAVEERYDAGAWLALPAEVSK
jgi:hypothetical protein